ncbi:hypothetical protein BOTCAL_0019g00210 [Botryotinia calthae]|uniref:Zn(2)-C6 fungal-type domain-containing protein n=1 Tax=Botryotinia calthae TaxID=38488 RepID=A0A4Y8DEW3_9HELO|nr:hypothetical protein BOTCAL_0019g00210 [Botryotinia calthae]
MVNTGKPSRGCYLCRSRRVKCDEQRPGCGNCKRLKRDCPGYRPVFEVMHRNGTSSTQRKTSDAIATTTALAAIQMARPHYRSKSESNIMPCTRWKPRQNSLPEVQRLVEAIQNGTQPVCPPLTAALEERAICFFLSNYVLIPHGAVRCGFLGFLLPLMKLQPSAVLSDSLSAVALATFGNQPNARMLKPKAEQAYSKALRHVTNAISDPKQATEDTTLAAVMLLALFETMAYSLVKENEGWNTWNSHVTGASALLKMRDVKGPMTPLTLELIWTVKGHLNLSCLLNGKLFDIPAEWNEVLNKRIDQTRGGPTMCNRLQSKVAKARVECDELMASAKRTPQDFENVLNLMRRAEAIEQSYSEWAESMPADWNYKPIGWIDAIPEDKLTGSKYFPGKIDKYHEVWAAHIWNLSRGSRLLNNSTIVRCAAWLCSPQDYRTTVEYEKATISGKEMIRDIIASVPNCLGEIPTAMDIKTPPGHSFACGDEKNARAKGLSGLFILWPMFSVATSDFVTDSQRKWVLGRMKYATEELGVSQGSTVYSEQHCSIRIPSSMLKKDGLMLSRVEEILNLQIPPVQQSFENVDDIWTERTRSFAHYPTPSPTSTSSCSPKAQHDWTLLNTGSHDMNAINNWPDQTQSIWFNPNLDTNVINSVEPAQQTLAVQNPHSDYPVVSQPDRVYHEGFTEICNI